MAYRCEAASQAGFIQQLAVGYISNGYYFYVAGVIPANKSADRVDAKILAAYDIGISKWTRARRKQAGQANVQYLRHGRFYVIIATHGVHPLFTNEAKRLRDCRKTPILFMGYSIGCRRERGGGAYHASVRINRDVFSELKARFAKAATHQTVEELSLALHALPYEPFAPVRQQYLTLLHTIGNGTVPSQGWNVFRQPLCDCVEFLFDRLKKLRYENTQTQIEMTGMKSDDENEWKMLTGSQIAVSSLELCCAHSHLARLPFHDLPQQMVVAIDGFALSGKFTIGERVAESIGGLLVDSARFYRALAKAATESSVDLSNENCIKQFCEGLTLDIHWDFDGCIVEEAIVSVNEHRFRKEELLFSRMDAAILSRVPEVRALVFDALRRCKKHGRLVVLGREIGGSVYPSTPFKFFVTAPRRVREERHFVRYRTWGITQLDEHERTPGRISNDALIVDTSVLLPDAALGVILTEIFLRAGKVIAH